MDGGDWWAAVHGIAKSRARLSDFTFTFQLSCIGEGNGNPLQCSCLENPRGWGIWWAAVYGVAQSLTQLKRLNSSSRAEGNILMLVRACMHYFSISSKAGSTLAFLLVCPGMDQKGGGSGGTWNLYVIKYKKNGFTFIIILVCQKLLNNDLT